MSRPQPRTRQKIPQVLGADPTQNQLIAKVAMLFRKGHDKQDLAVLFGCTIENIDEALEHPIGQQVLTMTNFNMWSRAGLIEALKDFAALTLLDSVKVVTEIRDGKRWDPEEEEWIKVRAPSSVRLKAATMLMSLVPELRPQVEAGTNNHLHFHTDELAPLLNALHSTGKLPKGPGIPAPRLGKALHPNDDEL